MVGDFNPNLSTIVCMNCITRNKKQLDRPGGIDLSIASYCRLMADFYSPVSAAICAASFYLIDESLDYNKSEDSYRTKHYDIQQFNNNYDICIRKEWTSY